MGIALRFIPPLLAACLTTAALGAGYTDRADGFSVTLPDSWQQSKAQGATAYFSGPTTAAGVTPNINVVVRTLPGALTLREASRLSGEGIAETFPGAKKANTYSGTLDGQPAISTVYTLPVKGLAVVSIQTIALFGKRVYVLTGTTSQADVKTFGPLNTAFVQNFHFLK